MRIAQALHWLKDFLAHPALQGPQKESLLQVATAPSDDHWEPGTPLSEVRHCHFTNTPEQMRQGLTHDYNFLEGDVRLEGGLRRVPGCNLGREPIMAHDLSDVHGLSLDEWLDVGQASGRGLKLDIKQAAALPQILERVKAHHLPPEGLIFNGDVLRGPGSPSAVKLRLANIAQDLTMDRDDLKRIRAEFPQSIISLGAYTGKQPEGTTYSSAQVRTMAQLADEVGGPISFPLRAEFITQEVVDGLKPHGIVSVWNDPSSWTPTDVEAETRRLRDMGVDGIIDLRAASA